MPIIYLVKDNNDLISHCTCEEALITFPGQADCPWCGCGWLFTCIKCRMAFTFARAVEWKGSWEELAKRDLEGFLQQSPDEEAIEEWVMFMQHLLATLEVGQQYVYLDGVIIPTDVSHIQFEGWHSHHDLDFVPQVAALDDPAIREELLTNPEYWIATQIDTSEHR